MALHMREQILDPTSCYLHILWEESRYDMLKLYQGKYDCYKCAAGYVLHKQLFNASIITDSLEGYFPSSFLYFFEKSVRRVNQNQHVIFLTKT